MLVHVQVAGFLQDTTTTTQCCTLLTSSLRLPLLSHAENTAGTLSWDCTQSITDTLATLPGPDLQLVMARFHLQEVFAAPLELLRAWLQHAAASGKLWIVEACPPLWSRLLRLLLSLSDLDIAHLRLPVDPEFQQLLVSRVGESNAQCALDSECADPPLLKHVTSIEIFSSISIVSKRVRPEYLSAILKLSPNISKLTCCGLAPSGDDWRNTAGSEGDISVVLPHLKSLQVLSMSFYHDAAAGQGLEEYTAFMQCLKHCTALKTVSIDSDNISLRTCPDIISGLGTTLVSVDLSMPVEIHWPSDQCSLEDVLSPLRDISGLTFLSISADEAVCANRPGESETGEDISVLSLLNVLGNVLEPLQHLRHLEVEAYRSRLRMPVEVSGSDIKSFVHILERLDVFNVDSDLLSALMPVLPVDVLHKLDSPDREALSIIVNKSQGRQGESALTKLTAVTSLSIGEKDPEYRNLLDVLQSLPCLKELSHSNGKRISRGTVSRACSENFHLLPAVACLSQLEILMVSTNYCITRGWEAFTQASSPPVAASLKDLRISEGNAIHYEDIPLFYSALGKLTALHHLYVNFLPEHSARFLTVLTSLRELENIDIVIGRVSDSESDRSFDHVSDNGSGLQERQGVQLDDSDVHAVGDALAMLTSLKSLRFNRLVVESKAAAAAFADHLTTLWQLTELRVVVELAEGSEGGVPLGDVVSRRCAGARIRVENILSAGKEY